SMADALVKEGLIKQEEADECRAVITHYYQNGHFVASGYHSAPVSRFQQDETYDSTQTVLNEQTTARTNFTFEGPKLSFAEERAFWKEAIGKNDAILTGGAETVSFKKERLGIYTKAQREALRKEREESGAAFSRYRGALSAKKKELQAQMKNALPGASEEAIKQLSAFHPALVSDKKEGAKQREEEFYALAKDILGMAQNAAPEEIAARKKAAIKTLLDRTKGDYPKGAKAWNVSDMVEDNVRKQPEKILYSGKLWANELLHNRILALQDLATGEEAKERFDKESYQDLRDMVLRDIPYAIYRKVLRSDWYQKLQDVGCRYQSLAEKRWEKLLSDANDVNNSRTLELDNGYMNEERYKLFGEFGIRVERPLRFEEEKKEEVSTEEAQEKVSEKVSEEKISEKAPEEKAAEEALQEKVEQPAPANPEMILRDGVEVPKLYIDANDPELIKTLADEKKVYRKEDYPQNQKAFYEQILRDNNAGVPIDFYDITIHRSPFMEEKFYRAMDSNGIEVERSNYFWKQDVAREVKEAYDWLYGYHRSHKDDVKEPEPIRYRKKINAPEKAGHIPYEAQGRSRYCWACTMSGLMNDYAGRKVSDLAMIKNRPLAIPSFEESGFTNRRAYDRGKALIEGMYEGTANGNPAIFGDYIVDKLPNTAVFTANIGRIQGQLDLCKRRFLETLSTRLEHGPVGLLYAGHFVTVYGLDGDKLMVRDSMAKNPDKVAAYEHTAASIFSQAGTQVELVWLENIENREAEIAQKYHLDYNPEQREFSGNINREKETILHRNGIEGTTGFTLGDVVSQQVYVPKRMQVGAPAGGEQEVPPQQQAGEQQVQQPRQQEVVEQKQEPLQQEKHTEEIKEAQKQTGIKKELPKVGSFKSITNLTTQLSRLNAPELKRAFNMNSFEMKL
ncbi:MAG: hypothetical protein IJ679_02820, partial [Lachnospiraceae bacterium]|nr:hypothetical protein [Lachnospiraceae bacterium]